MPGDTLRPANWSAFDSDSSALGLMEVLRRATNQHPLIEAARARVAAAAGARRTAGTLPNPIFTYSVENTGFPGRRAPPGLERETQTYATLPLEPLIQRRPRVRRADEDLKAANAVLARARQLVALDAARAFFRVAAAQIAVEGAEEVRARLAEIVSFNQARVNEGVASEADLIRAQLELDRLAASVTLERVELLRARADFATYVTGPADARMAIAVAEPVRIEGQGADVLRVSLADAAAFGDLSGSPQLGDLLLRAQAAHPDLVASRARAAAARAEVGYQQALTIRQVGATMGSKRSAGLTSMIAGVSLPIPLFDRNRGEIQRAVGERTAAEQESAWAERQVAAEVQAAYEAARLLTDQATRLRGSFLNRAAESLRLAVAAYQEGAVSLLQVFDASRTLADARLAYYQTVFAQRQRLLELQAAVGADPLDALVSPSSRPLRPSGERP